MKHTHIFAFAATIILILAILPGLLVLYAYNRLTDF
jgi:hypothetical protein